jgi:hypothetical protein
MAAIANITVAKAEPEKRKKPPRAESSLTLDKSSGNALTSATFQHVLVILHVRSLTSSWSRLRSKIGVFQHSFRRSVYLSNIPWIADGNREKCEAHLRGLSGEWDGLYKKEGRFGMAPSWD